MTNVVPLPPSKQAVSDTTTKILGCEPSLTLAGDLVAVEFDQPDKEFLVGDLLPPTGIAYGPPTNKRQFRLYRTTAPMFPEIAGKLAKHPPSLPGRVFLGCDPGFKLLSLRAAPDAVPMPPEHDEPAVISGLSLMRTLRTAATNLLLRLSWQHECKDVTENLVRALATELLPLVGNLAHVKAMIRRHLQAVGYTYPPNLKKFEAAMEEANYVGLPRGFYWPVVANLLGAETVNAIRAIWDQEGEAVSLPASYVDLLRNVKQGAQFMMTEFAERDFYVEPFLTAASINLLVAPRGVGKTMCCLALARSLTKGEPFFAWKVPKPRRVLFVEGEMPGQELKFRISRLGIGDCNNLLILASQVVYDAGLPPLNIATPEGKQAVQGMVDKFEPDLLILDSRSSLMMGPGIEENSNDDPCGMRPWLMSLRHQGVAVLLVVHAGKDAERGPRGGSAIEDNPDTEITLTEVKDPQGGHFKISFAKHRGEPPTPYSLDVKLCATTVPWSWKWDCGAPAADADFDQHLMSILECVASGNPMTMEELGKKFGHEKGWASKNVTKLKKGGYLKNGEGLTGLTPKGKEMLEMKEQM